MFDVENVTVEGHLLCRYKDNKEVLVDKFNAIHPGNLTLAIASAMTGDETAAVNFVVFGNGGTILEPSGRISYKNPNVGLVADTEAAPYNPTYSKALDPNDENNRAIAIQGQSNFADIEITTTLDFGEPQGQQDIDQSIDNEGDFVFDEIALYNGTEISSLDPFQTDGRLLTHVIFHPQQKSLNRVIEVIYTLRIQIQE